MPLLRNSLHSVTIDGMASDGSGVVRIDGQVVFVRGALDGEKCVIRILKPGKSVSYAKIEQLTESSAHRQEPGCPIFGKCGGCCFQHVDYDTELIYKKQFVDDALHRIGGLDLKTDCIIGADSVTGYRNKAVYAVGPGPKVGFYRERSHEILPAFGCLIQGETAAEASKAVLDWMHETGTPAYDEETEQGLIRHIFVRQAFGTGESALCVVSAEPVMRTARLTELVLERCPEITSIVVNINRRPGNAVLGAGGFKTLWGRPYIEDTLCGLKFKLSPVSFYQTNREQAEKLYNTAIGFAELTGAETVFDLYCGTGTIGLAASRHAKLIVGAEIVPDAIEDAKQNALNNGIENACFICADAGSAAETLKSEGIRPDVVIVDPPRKGLDESVVTSIAGLAPGKLVYVSCDAATLARDLKRFTQLGYSPVRAVAVDMFPRTRHVETVVLLVLRNPVTHINIDVDVEEMVQDKRGQATYPQIKAYVLEHSGLKVSSLYIAQVKQKYGIIERENYNKAKTEDAKQPQCPPDKEKALIEALKHFGMLMD